MTGATDGADRPILDDRTYEQLREELVRRIPVYTPEWTDHNETDPGIALLELFAYLGESLLYRFNQIPDTTKVAFLRLLGVQPRPAQCARLAGCGRAPSGPTGVQVLRGERRPRVRCPSRPTTRSTSGRSTCVGRRRRWRPAAGRVTRLRQAAEPPPARTPPRAIACPTGTPYDVYLTRLVPADPAEAAESLDVGATLDQSLWVAVLRARRPPTWRSCAAGPSSSG